MYGDDAATKKAESDFKVYSEEVPGKTKDTYSVNHSAQIFAFDSQGRVRLIFGPGFKPDEMASDLHLLLNSQG